MTAFSSGHRIKAFPYRVLVSLEGWCESRHVGRRKYSPLGAKSCIVAVPRNLRRPMEPALQERCQGRRWHREPQQHPPTHFPISDAHRCTPAAPPPSNGQDAPLRLCPTETKEGNCTRVGMGHLQRWKTSDLKWLGGSI